MIETEAKILGIDTRKVEIALAKLGAKKSFEGEIEAIILDYPDSSMWSSGRLIRLRKKGKGTELTFKKMLGKGRVKRALELETTVSDFEKTRAIFLAIGLIEKKRSFKKRSSYRLGSAEFEIDTLPGIPPYLEIEAKDEREVFRLASLLGFSKRRVKPWSMRDVIAHYRGSRKTV